MVKEIGFTGFTFVLTGALQAKWLQMFGAGTQKSKQISPGFRLGDRHARLPRCVESIWQSRKLRLTFEIPIFMSNTLLWEGMDWFGLFLSQILTPRPLLPGQPHLSTFSLAFLKRPKTQQRTRKWCSAFRFLWKWGMLLPPNDHEPSNSDDNPSIFWCSLFSDPFVHMYVDMAWGIPWHVAGHISCACAGHQGYLMFETHRDAWLSRFLCWFCTLW